MPADPILNYNDVRWDARGPYWVTQSGKKSYIPPAAAAQSHNPQLVQWAASKGEVLSPTGQVSNAAPDATFAKSRGVWNPTTGQFDQSLNQGGLGGAIEGAAGLAVPTVIGPAIAGALGGPGAATGAAFDAAPAWGSGGYANAAALGATPAGGAAATGGGGIASVIKALTSTSNIPSLIGLGTSLLGGMRGGSGSQNGELDRIKQITEARMRRVDPLHQAITSLAMSRLPTNMQRPVPDVPLPEQK